MQNTPQNDSGSNKQNKEIHFHTPLTFENYQVPGKQPTYIQPKPFIQPKINISQMVQPIVDSKNNSALKVTDNNNNSPRGTVEMSEPLMKDQQDQQKNKKRKRNSQRAESKQNKSDSLNILTINEIQDEAKKKELKKKWRRNIMIKLGLWPPEGSPYGYYNETEV